MQIFTQIIYLIEKINFLCGLVCKRVGLFLASKADNKHSILYSLSLLSVTTAEEYTTMVIVIGGIVVLYFYIILSSRISTHSVDSYGFITKKSFVKISILLCIPHSLSMWYLISTSNQLSAGRVLITIVLIQLLIVLPAVRALSAARHWKPYMIPYHFSQHQFNAWGSPILFLHLARGVLYPLFFVGFLVLVRALLLGSSRDMSWLFNLPPEALPIITYLLCYYPCYWLLLLKYVELRRKLWNDWVITMEAINLPLVQKDLFFNTLQRLHGASSLINFLLSIHRYNMEATPIQQIVSKYLNKINFILSISPLLGLIFLITEIAYTKTLYYSPYVLITITILRSSLWILENFYSSGWHEGVSTSDYLYQNFQQPHIPGKFWQLYLVDKPQSIAETIGFAWILNKEQTEINSSLRKKHFIKAKNAYAQTTSNHPLSSSILARHERTYLELNGLKYNYTFKRTTHTTTIIKSTCETIYHKAIGHFHIPGAPAAIASLLNIGKRGEGWKQHFDPLTCKECKDPIGYALNMVQNAQDLIKINNGNPKVPNYATLIDYWQLLHFRTLLKYKYFEGVTLYKESTSASTLYKPQPCQDAILKFKDIPTPVVVHINDVSSRNDHYSIHLPHSYWPPQGYNNGNYKTVDKIIPSTHKVQLGGNYIGMDLKIPTYTHGANTMTLYETPAKYIYALEHHFKPYYLQYGGTEEVVNDFIKALRTAETHEECQLIWAHFVRFFFPMQPPYIVESLIPTQYFTEKAQQQISLGKEYHSKSNKLLLDAKIPNSGKHTPLLDQFKAEPEHSGLLNEVLAFMNQ